MAELTDASEPTQTGRRTIEGVSTSTAGFAGETERGPTRPTLVTSWADYVRWFGAEIDDAPFARPSRCLPYAVRGFFENGGSRLFVARVVGGARRAASVEIPGVADPLTVRACGPGPWGNQLVVTVAARDHAATDAPATHDALHVRYYRRALPPPLADWVDGQPVPPGFDWPPPDAFEVLTSPGWEAPSHADGQPRLVEIDQSPSFAGLGPTAYGRSWRLGGGAAAAAVRDDYAGSQVEGLAGLFSIDEIAIVAVPDEAEIPQLSNDLLDRCEASGDRFAVLSAGGPGTVTADVRAPRDSSLGALYVPHVRVPAPHLPGGTACVPATGHVAGIYARTDLERGVHKAPANEIVHGLTGGGDGEPLLSPPITDAEQDVLRGRGVNAIRDFTAAGRGVRVWGARTMSSDPTWKYVNVRRLLLFVEQSIARGTHWVVFEPNAPPTWAALRDAVTSFLHALWRTGALMGMTPDEAFFVTCDRTTMTQDDLDNGRLICLIGVAPLRPSEFVILRLSRLIGATRP